MTVLEILIASLVKALYDAVGHDEAHRLITDEDKRRAYALADAVAAARVLSGT